MPGKKLFLTIFFCLYFCSLGSSDLFAEYRFDSWTTDNGLPQNGLRQITQTPDGYLWFTTFDGLVRFDGIKFTVFNKGNTPGITNSRFYGIYSDKVGTIYAITEDDGVLTVYKDGFFKTYNSNEVPGRAIKLIKPDENGETRFLVEEDHNWFEQWYYLRDGKFILDEEFDNRKRIVTYKGQTGKIWKASENEIIESKNGEETKYKYKFKSLNSDGEIFEDRKGGLWISGTSLVRLQNGEIKYLGKEMDFPHNSDFHSFWEDKEGNLWFANGGRREDGLGLVRYKDGKFQVFGKPEGLTNTSIHDVFHDREGNVWLATSKGLNLLRKNVINVHSVSDGLSNQEVYPIYKDSKNNIWVGTSKGLNIYRNGKFEQIDFKYKGTPYSNVAGWQKGTMSIQSILEDSNGKMWFGVSGGIHVVEDGKTEMLEASESHHVFSIIEDKNKTIWAATNKGILQFENYELKKHYTDKDGLPKNFMTIAFEDSNKNLWFGGAGGLSKFEDGKFKNYTKEEGLTGNYVRSIYEDSDGTFWIGTYDEGLSRFKDGQFVNFKRKDGLYSNGVFAIQEDKFGYFWISSNQGIYRVKKNHLTAFADGKIKKIPSVGYGKEDGMLNNECNGGRQPASFKDDSGNFWFPTQDGIVIVNPEFETYDSLPPTVAIESATIERKKINIKNNLVIEPGQKNFEINFTGISFIKPKQIKFQYKLVGHDANWIDAGTRRTAYYSYLPPGEYIFQVRAVNSSGVWNQKGAILKLKLKPYFYETYSFYLLIFLVFILIFLAIWRISLYQLRIRQKLLLKLVNEKTAELKKANEELQQLANSDGLTAVGNRRRFEEFLADEWHRAIRFKTEISLVMLDIDHFKLFNDTYGHQAGDDCLKRVAEALTKTIHRPTDLVARFGGEEFVIILGGTDMDGALQIAKLAAKYIRELEIPHSKSETSEYLTVSIGVATMFVSLGMSESELIEEADLALYQAKETGRNKICTYDSYPPKLPNSEVILQDNNNIN